MQPQMIRGFRDELIKIASSKVAEMDPELMQLQESNVPDMPSRWNDETTKQFILDTALIGAGTGLGYGAGKLTLRALHGKQLPEAVTTTLRMGAPLIGGVGAIALRNLMRNEARKRMSEAEARSLPVRTAAP